MLIITYTKEEMTVKKCDVEFMFKQARAVLIDKYNYHGPILVTEMPRGDQLYTVERASFIIEQLIVDTILNA